MTRTIAVLMMCAAAVGAAADETQWSDVQSLRAGDRVGVIQSNQKRVEGRFTSADDSGISIAADGDVRIARAEVVRVYRRPALKRSRRALLGAGIGAAAGGIVAAGIANGSSGEGFFGGAWEGAAVTTTVIGGAGIGAAAGALSGGGYKTVYRKTN